jgi:RNA polymerase sigma factor (sigma-70 family)
MAKAELQGLIRRMCDSLGLQSAERISDTDLLERFLTQEDHAAFEVLVWRHGSMVLSVCSRVLHNGHDAEDAFQATFLALVRKAGTIGQRESLAGWLYRVAYRIALRARGGTARRAAREQLGLDFPAPASDPDPADEISYRDLQRVLDEELNQLPSRYRIPLVLCYLEGLTNEEAARQLGCPRGTIATRLARARDRLRSRLHRRGVVLSALSLGAVLADANANASLPAVLVSTATKAAALFSVPQAAQGTPAPAGSWAATAFGARRAARSTLLAAGTLIVAVLAASAAGVAYYRAHAAPAASSRGDGSGNGSRCCGSAATFVPQPDAELPGTWQVVTVGKTEGWLFTAIRPKQRVEITSERMLFRDDIGGCEVAYEVDPTQKPRLIDLTPQQGHRMGDRLLGVYLLEGDRLTLTCELMPMTPRPKSLAADRSSVIVLQFQRQGSN